MKSQQVSKIQQKQFAASATVSMPWKRHVRAITPTIYRSCSKRPATQTNEAKNVKFLFQGAWWEIMCEHWGERKKKVKASRRLEEKPWTQTAGRHLSSDTKRTNRKRKAANKLHNLCLFHLFKFLSTPSSLGARRAGNVTVGSFQTYYSDLLLSPAFWIINWQRLHHKHWDPARSNYGVPCLPPMCARMQMSTDAPSHFSKVSLRPEEVNSGWLLLLQGGGRTCRSHATVGPEGGVSVQSHPVWFLRLWVSSTSLVFNHCGMQRDDVRCCEKWAIFP